MDDDFSRDEESNSNHSSTYSDKIDSDLEAELYSIIHHQETLSSADYFPQCTKESFKSFDAAKCGDKVNNSNGEFMLTSSFLNVSSNESEDFKEDSLTSFQEKNETITVSPTKCKTDLKHDLHGVISLSDSSEPCVLKFENTTGYFKKPCNNILKSKNNSPSIYKGLDSSDSEDSVIFIDDDNNLKKDLQFNMINEVDIDLISNSSDDSDSVTPYIQPKNVSPSPVKRKKCTNSNDAWYIDEEDQHRRKRRSKVSQELNCSNCNRKGHTARFCNAEKSFRCFICGGNHMASQCENRICSKCYHMGHDSRICYMQLVGNCHLCKMSGHKAKDCPDHWRRYYLTTEKTNFICGEPLVQDGFLYCFNCGFPGHMGSVCRERRFPGTTWPCVISYLNPNDRFGSQRNSFASPVASRLGNQNKNVAKYKFPKPVQDFINERKNTQKDPLVIKRKKPKIWEIYKQRKMEQKQKKMALRGKDFPRTPKLPREKKSFEDLPESVQIDMKKAEKNRQKRKRLKLNKRKNKINQTVAKS